MVDRANEPFLPPSIGPYRVIRELGRGGMGVVYEGLHTHLQRRVAIKQMRAELLDDPTQVERFVREGRAACRIRHPNVVDLFELAFVGDVPYLVMDYLEGQTLAERLDEVGRVPLESLLAIMFPVLSAVVAAHEVGIVHRDLKPANIMLARADKGRTTPKLLDFGTSKLPSLDAPALTESSTLLGTPYYMSPEQVRASKSVDARCDQYALGVILYECSTGVRPFRSDSTYGLIHAIMTAPVTPPSVHVPALPAQFDAVVLRALQREPEQRFTDVRALGAALLPLASEALSDAWRAEFAGPEAVPSRPRDALAAPLLATLPDEQRATTEHKPAPEHVRARARWPLVLSLALLVALASWALRAGSNSAPSDRAMNAASVTRRVATPVPKAEAGASHAAVVQVPSASAEPASLTDAGARTVSPVLSVLPARSAPPPIAKRRSHTRAPRGPGVQAETPPEPALVRPALGDNGAPILE